MVMKSRQQGVPCRYRRALIERGYLSLRALLGIDPDPESHTAVALDHTGKKLSHITVPNQPEGLATLEKWLKAHTVEVCAVEGANKTNCPMKDHKR